jgi:hypothetical protein
MVSGGVIRDARTIRPSIRAAVRTIRLLANDRGATDDVPREERADPGSGQDVS